MQLMYMTQMTQMKQEQFDESVNRALYQTSRNMELNETLRYLEADLRSSEHDEIVSDTVRSGGHSSFEIKKSLVKPSSMPKGMILNSDRNATAAVSKSMQDLIRNRYIYQKAMLDDVVYSILYTASDKSLDKRINFKQLDQDLKAELMNNGINIQYHFRVLTSDGREVYRCPDYKDDGCERAYNVALFRNDPQAKMGVLRVHFPQMGEYIFDSIKFVVPSLIFTLILLAVFIYTIFVVFRQKKVSEMKNDFINNMTHELKTPISSISLAAQMINDKNVVKSEGMLKHLAGVMNSESKRLQFLVDKVLQYSMIEKQKTIYNKQELDINEMVEKISETFKLRVEHTGGHIITDIEAVDSAIYVDEMHFQNVIFNLLDNAVKYRQEEQPIELFIKTWNPDERHVSMMIEDNGIGIKRENLKKIFEKFYRVHTGNVHNVKGFGLGLAYVKQIVDIHDGAIEIESELKRGTRVTITLEIINN